MSQAYTQALFTYLCRFFFVCFFSWRMSIVSFIAPAEATTRAGTLEGPAHVIRHGVHSVARAENILTFLERGLLPSNHHLQHSPTDAFN